MPSHPLHCSCRGALTLGPPSPPSHSDLAAGTSPSKAFEADPAAFAKSLYRGGQQRGRLREAEGLPAPAGLPSHVACFDAHCAALAPVLGSLGFREVSGVAAGDGPWPRAPHLARTHTQESRIFHTHVTGDADAEQSASYIHVWRLTAERDPGTGDAASRQAVPSGHDPRGILYSQ